MAAHSPADVLSALDYLQIATVTQVSADRLRLLLDILTP
jgi:hypothetical protein